jgi:hypothetical protein
MQPIDQLPDQEIQPKGPVSRAFQGLKIAGFRNACRYIFKLPYGRNSDRSNYRQVLSENKGTCSTKHALIACLAEELSIPISLTLGIYKMQESNTPGVGNVLQQFELDFILEAHCYLRYKDLRIDLTKETAGRSEPIDEFLYEENIVPDQIGEYKIELHQTFMKRHYGEDRFDRMWSIREQCIRAISD